LLAEGHHVARGFDANFFAGLALFVVEVFLRFLVQGPAQFKRQSFGHERAQVGMGAHFHGVTAAALVASALLGWRFTQPSAGQFQAKRVLTHARGALQQPSMTASLEQAGELAL
jgi:hypothetical protein